MGKVGQRLDLRAVMAALGKNCRKMCICCLTAIAGRTMLHRIKC